MDMKEYQGLLTDATEYAMLREVHCGPKPGLVDRFNQGSHEDMDEAMFIRSAKSLTPWFGRFMALSAQSPSDLVLPGLRGPGMAAERAMLSATGGTNTHKGLIFSLGLLSACLIRLFLKLEHKPGLDDLSALASLIRANATDLTRELDTIAPSSHGRAVYEKHGLKGIRQEAEAGFPAVFATGLPSLNKYRELYPDEDLPCLLTLLELILVTDDTNLVRRGGLEGLAFMRKRSRALLQAAPELTRAELLHRFKEFDEDAIHLRLSPGGAADHLALTIFLDRVLREDPPE